MNKEHQTGKSRRPHHKSRNGCAQCKQRKVKVCDWFPFSSFELSSRHSPLAGSSSSQVVAHRRAFSISHYPWLTLLNWVESSCRFKLFPILSRLFIVSLLFKEESIFFLTGCRRGWAVSRSSRVLGVLEYPLSLFRSLLGIQHVWGISNLKERLIIYMISSFELRRSTKCIQRAVLLSSKFK